MRNTAMLTCRVSPDTVGTARRVAEWRRQSVSDVVRDALEAGLAAALADVEALTEEEESRYQAQIASMVADMRG